MTAMVEIKFPIGIRASRAVIWQAMTEDATYREWMAAFIEGSHLYRIDKQSGLIAEIKASKMGERLYRRHIYFEYLEGKITVMCDDKPWNTADEIYTLSRQDESGEVRLSFSTKVEEQDKDFMDAAFRRGLSKLKEIAERMAAESN